MLKTIFSSFCATVLIAGLACNVFVIIPNAIVYRDVHKFDRYYQYGISFLVFLCTVLLSSTCVYVWCASRNNQGARRISRELIIFTCVFAFFGTAFSVTLLIGKSILYAASCYYIVIIDLPLADASSKFSCDVTLISALIALVIVCPVYIILLNRYERNLNEGGLYLLNLAVMVTLALVFVKVILFEAVNNIERLNGTIHEKDDCYYHNGTNTSTFLYDNYLNVESLAYSLIVKLMPIFYLVIEDLKKAQGDAPEGEDAPEGGEDLEGGDARERGDALEGGDAPGGGDAPEENGAINLFHPTPTAGNILVFILCATTIFCSFFAFSINFWSNPTSNNIKSGMTAFCYVCLIFIGLWMMKCVDFPDRVEANQIWNDEPDAPILRYTLLPAIFQLSCSFVSGWIRLLDPYHKLHSKSSIIFSITYQLCDLVQIWVQFYVGKWMTIVHKRNPENVNTPHVITVGSLVYFVTNILFALDTFILETHVIRTSTPLSSLMNRLVYALMISVTMPAFILFRSRLAGMFAGFFLCYWLHFFRDMFVAFFGKICTLVGCCGRDSNCLRRQPYHPVDNPAPDNVLDG